MVPVTLSYVLSLVSFRLVNGGLPTNNDEAEPNADINSCTIIPWKQAQRKMDIQLRF